MIPYEPGWDGQVLKSLETERRVQLFIGSISGPPADATEASGPLYYFSIKMKNRRLD